ncbi:hypothetical protein GCM10023144_06030 [Pigmentiphaga soli]|uniref:Chromate transporter n=1 Tax=Pigmentiphaga soli TaxID=1007095 RepID=A0ABP8GHN2_9BURK
MNVKILLNILGVFGPLSLLTVGGGQSVIADVHRQAVDVYGWMSDAEFLNLYALSRIIPGPGSLLATLVGWQAAGLAGALVASVGIFIPSSVLVYALAHVWARFRHTPGLQAIEAGLVPVAAGMILAASCTILRAAEGGVWAWGMAAVSTLALMYTRISPFVMLGIGAVLFLAVQP